MIGTARFVHRLAGELRQMPVWLVSSGPLDDSATRSEIAPVPQVRRLCTEIEAWGHVTFGGRRRDRVPGPCDSQNQVGRLARPDQVRNWSQAVAAELLSRMVA